MKTAGRHIGTAMIGGWGSRSRFELLANLVQRDLKGRYKNSVLGFLWSLLTPLLMAAVYVFFLRMLAGRAVSLEAILIGVFAWQYTVQSVQSGMGCITGNANLVKKVAFPRMVLPVATTASNLANYLLSLIVQFLLVGVLLASKGQGYPAAAWLVPAVILAQTALNLALALLLGAANTYFRDTTHLVGIALSAWFFVSPVMYDLDFVRRFADSRPWLEPLFLLNPLAPLLTAYRALLLPGVAFPSHSPYAWAGLLLSPALLPLAAWTFRRAQRNFADVL